MLRYFSSALQLDTLSTKHDHRWIHEHCEHARVSACGIGAADIELKIFSAGTD